MTRRHQILSCSWRQEWNPKMEAGVRHRSALGQHQRWPEERFERPGTGYCTDLEVQVCRKHNDTISTSTKQEAEDRNPKFHTGYHVVQELLFPSAGWRCRRANLQNTASRSSTFRLPPAKCQHGISFGRTYHSSTA